MYTVERQRQIMQILIKKHRCSVKELSNQLFASEATIRRDLNTLASEGKLQKVFGGAILYEQYAEEVPFGVRQNEHLEIKQQICKEAASLLHDGMTIFLDASTTPESLIPHLKCLRHLQIVTNNPRIPLYLADTSFQVYCTGGRMSRSSQAYVGALAEDAIEQMNADIYFFSSRGISTNGIITDSSQNEARLKRKMLEHSSISCFLGAAEKLGQKSTFTIADCSEVDYVLSNVPLDPVYLGKKQR